MFNDEMAREDPAKKLYRNVIKEFLNRPSIDDTTFDDDTNLFEIAAVCSLLAFDSRKQDRTISMVNKMIELDSVYIKRNNLTKTGQAWLFYDYEQKPDHSSIPIDLYRLYDGSYGKDAEM
ncbi:MAG: hypothetical protein K6F03_10485 [Saccharofermentans sp.]|nr:hypothetical protein [Saccharofermentans sp.]